MASLSFGTRRRPCLPGPFCLRPQVPVCFSRFGSWASRTGRKAGPKPRFGHDPFVKVCSGVTIKQKYVNMTDIIFPRDAGLSGGAQGAATAAEGEPIWDLIELLFFAYRDFVSDPDHVLEKFGLAARIIGCCISSIATPA